MDTPSTTESKIHHKSAYIVVFQHSFFEDLFYHNLSGISHPFECLTTKNCLADLVSSGYTDFNLNDGRFWLKFDFRMFDANVEFSRAYNDDDYWNLHHAIWRIRTKEDMEQQGYSTEQLFRHIHPTWKIIKSPFVPAIGELRVIRNAIPHCQRSDTHWAVASLFRRDLGLLTMVGLSKTKDQSLSHVPLTVGKDKTVHFFDLSSEKTDQISLPESVISTSGKLRVHFYPYGLCTSYLIISLSASQGFSTTDLIVFLKRLSSPKESGSDRISCIIGRQYSGPMIRLHYWVKDQICRALLRSPERSRITSSQMHSVVCLNTEQVLQATGEALPKEILGILMRDTNWTDFNEMFARSYRSFFGRYEGEFSISTADNLLVSFGSTWGRHSKRKPRVRFYWGLLSTFEYIVARKFLCILFTEEIKRAVKELLPSGPEIGTRIRRMRAWLDSNKLQHRRLHPARRKFFHKVAKIVSLDALELDLAENLDQCQKRAANNKLIKKTTVLFLAADPTNASRLRVGQELREIQEKLQLAKLREEFKLYTRMSIRPVDISQALLDLQPQIVHFSGHGTRAGELCFEDEIGKTHSVRPDALAALFEQFAEEVNCVILNACYSESQAKAIATHIDYVIGMNAEIGDKAAIAFSIGFYQALGAGRSIEEAYKLGCIQISLQGIPENLTPVLIRKDSGR